VLLNTKRGRLTGAAGVVAVLALILCLSLNGQVVELHAFAAYPAVGSWLGRATPIAGSTACPVGSAGCPIPKEIIMLFTIHADGNFVAIDSNIFKGGNHTTAHGQWAPRPGYGIVRATFSLLQEANGIFIGGFKNVFDGTLTDANNMKGQLHAYLYSYTDANGDTIVGPDGMPTPNPLAPPAQCANTKGCSFLADFQFVAQRVQVAN
jgi:hypothetical protein